MCLLKDFHQSQQLRTIAKKRLQFYTVFLCYLDSDEILSKGSWKNKGLIYMLLCEDFVKFDV